jgi:hypothetical protein
LRPNAEADFAAVCANLSMAGAGEPVQYQLALEAERTAQE